VGIADDPDDPGAADAGQFRGSGSELAGPRREILGRDAAFLRGDGLGGDASFKSLDAAAAAQESAPAAARRAVAAGQTRPPGQRIAVRRIDGLARRRGAGLKRLRQRR